MSHRIPIRVAIVGTGNIGKHHATGLRASRRFAVDAACDPDAARLQAFGTEYGIPRLHQDPRTAFADPRIDAVLLLVPHHLHEPMAVEALRAGKHVLLEKPISRTLAEADRLIAEASAAKRTLMIAHNQRFCPAAARLRDAISDGAIGTPYFGEASHHQDFTVAPGNWWRSRELVGGGSVIASGVHRLDLLRWYLGEVSEVSAYASHDTDRLEGECVAVASLRFASGALASFHCNWGLTAPYGKSRFGETLSVFGKCGHLALPDGSSDQLLIKTSGADERIVTIGPDAYPSMWAHFADCIETGAEPLTSGAEARRSLALVLAIYRAIATGKAVSVDPSGRLPSPAIGLSAASG
jgi:UDP-N-acetyl-2-amino-2-deoxyglucuronate dehydrogenase